MTKSNAMAASIGCGCATASMTFLGVGGIFVLAAWAAFEADLTEMEGEVAIPLGIGLGLLAAVVVGPLAGWLTARYMRRRESGGAERV